uniref:CRISPR-associated protein Cas5 n=1 Tax=Methylovulum miyakonense TaxID=645578 RepID=UPI0038CC1C54
MQFYGYLAFTRWQRTSTAPLPTPVAALGAIQNAWWLRHYLTALGINAILSKWRLKNRKPLPGG